LQQCDIIRTYEKRSRQRREPLTTSKLKTAEGRGFKPGEIITLRNRRAFVMTKAQAGSRGGKKTVQKYGPEHMREIGKRGAATTWTRYHWSPIGQNNFALVERETGQVVAYQLPVRE
jgi:hypothetical protein